MRSDAERAKADEDKVKQAQSNAESGQSALMAMAGAGFILDDGTAADAQGNPLPAPPSDSPPPNGPATVRPAHSTRSTPLGLGRDTIA